MLLRSFFFLQVVQTLLYLRQGFSAFRTIVTKLVIQTRTNNLKRINMVASINAKMSGETCQSSSHYTCMAIVIRTSFALPFKLVFRLFHVSFWSFHNSNRKLIRYMH
ncbi:hypothetical protein BDA99DRAFT_542807 [Phascolomyces articulosus]|uniref:Secreted protein n=1 Tax=Phascolomyces articulosus TaxID=60185 RepID=A0AAD5JZ92_9FUNG|nr:hypothetical protein BDA99DRAFT_542807 [Phascolomyces articulosus]